MTNSASEPGSDDILASIRRLVSAAPARSEPQGDRLLLTPALRVPEADEDDTPAIAAPRGLSLEDRIAELEAAVGSQSVEFEPDGSEVAHIGPPDDLVRAVENLEFGQTDDDTGEDTGKDTREDTGHGEPAAEAVPSPDDRHAPLVPRAEADAPEAAAEPVAGARSERRGLFLAVPSNDNTAERPDRSAEATGGGAEGLPAGLFFTRHDRPADENVPDIAPEVVPDQAISPARVTGSDTAPADDSSDPAPEDLSADDVAVGEDGLPAERPEADAPGMPTFRHAIHREDAPAEPPADTAPVDSVEIDEERLRAIVAELLRDELQGPLGEKITRNIRKLVRREIERALAVRDFD